MDVKRIPGWLIIGAGLMFLVWALATWQKPKPSPDIAMTMAGLECWQMQGGELQQDGWRPAHFADKWARLQKQFRPEASLLCFEVDRDGLPTREHYIRQWWVK